MSTYVIGDIQGCFGSLQSLLDSFPFDFDRDRLWLVGDLVNRGPDSLATLRFVRDLGERAVCVLGNHDLHLLSVAAGCSKLRDDDTLDEVLQARDRDECYRWALGQLGYDPSKSTAGLSPSQSADYYRAMTACLDGRGYSVR